MAKGLKTLSIITFFALNLTSNVWGDSPELTALENCTNAAVKAEKKSPSPELNNVLSACEAELASFQATLPAQVAGPTLRQIKHSLEHHLKD